MLKRSASKSLSLLWWCMIKPPFLHINEWSTEKISPQTHQVAMSSIGQSYRNLMVISCAWKFVLPISRLNCLAIDVVETWFGRRGVQLFLRICWAPAQALLTYFQSQDPLQPISRDKTSLSNWLHLCPVIVGMRICLRALSRGSNRSCVSGTVLRK